jgi:hypothetical protein
MGKTAKEIFDTDLPLGLKAQPDKARLINAIYAFQVSGPNGGNWTVDLKSDPPSCKPEAAAGAQCTLKLVDKDFEALVGNPSLGMQLYMQGKLKVSGDPSLAMKVQALLQIALGR